MKNYAAEAKVTKDLVESQQAFYEQRIKDFRESTASMVYRYDEALGTLQYAEGGLDFIATVEERDNEGKYVNTADKQLALIEEHMEALGLNVEEEIKKLAFNENNEKIELVQSGNRFAGNSEEENATIVENFFNSIDMWVNELDGLNDTIADNRKKLAELVSKEMEIRQEYIDNELKLEEDVLKAIEDRRQKIIDELEKSKEAIQKANEAYIQGLSDALEKERNLYEQNKNDQELSKLQRQLTILQRTGGSASEIHSLQEQINSQMQDRYFEKQQEQIDAIQEASDKQIEAMEEQIDIMKESLEYQKENGLLYEEVREIMAQSPEQIVQFITENSKDWSEKSVLAKEEDLRELRKSVEMYFDSTAKGLDGMAWDVFTSLQKDTYSKNTWDTVGKQAEEKFREVYNQTAGNVEEASRAANTILTAAEPKEEEETSTEPVQEIDQRIPAQTTKKAYMVEDETNKKIKVPSGSSLKIAAYHEENGQIAELWVEYNGKIGKIPYDAVSVDETELRKIGHYKEGGLIKNTGLAWVDGTSSNPEAVLTAKQFEELEALTSSNLSDSIQSIRDNFYSFIDTFTASNQAVIDSMPSESGIINIENFDFNMNVESIANDYDAQQAGRTAFDEMIKIARKTTNRTLNRR